MTRGRVAPALLVLLLGVRVATAAAVECQHELTSAARAAEQAQEALRNEARALGGELCLVEAGSATAHDEDGPHLSSPCPFFKSPVTLPAIVSDAVPHEAGVSNLWQGLDSQHAKTGARFAAYRPRGPPDAAGEVLARAPRPCSAHTVI